MGCIRILQLVVLSLTCMCSCQGQTCNVDTIQVKDNFDVNRFAGRWYYVKLLPFSWLPPGILYRDFFLQYTAEQTGYRVLWYGRIAGTPGCTDGASRLYSTRSSAKYLAEQKFNETTTFNVTSWIIETDYDNYGLLYGCVETSAQGFCKEPALTMLSRKKQLEPRYMNAMQNLLPSLCLGNRASALIDVEQDEGCFSACDLEPCANGGTCNDWQHAPGYYCWCLEGFTGFNCSNVLAQTTPEPTPRNACVRNPCMNGATCRLRPDFDVGYECLCLQNFRGSLCENTDTESTPRNICVRNPCRNGATCRLQAELDVGYECLCPRGFMGSLCENTDTDSIPNICPLNPCMHGASCMINPQASLGFDCRCTPGTSGDFCENIVDANLLDTKMCPLNPCAYGGICVLNDNTGIQCMCPAGFSGPLCDRSDRELQNPCNSQPCLNGGACTAIDWSNFDCSCPADYIGNNCEQRKPEPCGSNPCRNGGTCNRRNADEYECSCPRSYEGRTCGIFKDPCRNTPCRNGGSCNPRNADEYECLCTRDYEGRTCDIFKDPCRNNPCRNGGTCNRRNADDYECFCTQDYEGRTCDIFKDPCRNNPCRNGGTCNRRNADDYECFCTRDYEGRTCDIFKDPCRNNPCRNGGTCNRRNADDYECFCTRDYEGRTCDIFKDPCRNNPCRNGGSCNRRNADDYECFCTRDYEGRTCDTFKGLPCDSFPCRNGGTCTNENSQFRCSCTQSWTGITCESEITTTTPRTTTSYTSTPSPSGGQLGGSDIAFILDSSGSVNSYNFIYLILPFVAQIVERLDIGLSMTQVGIVTFNEKARIAMKLDEHLDKRSLVQAIKSLSYVGQPATNISGAIWLTRTQFFNKDNGSRPNYPKLAVLIIDGESSIGGHMVDSEARAAHDAGIRMIVIAVGGWVQQREINAAATNPSDRNSLRLPNFSAFETPTPRDFVFRVLKEYVGEDTAVEQNLWECGFEKEEMSPLPNRNATTWCNMEQPDQDDLDWTPSPENGKTPSSQTGPNSAYSQRSYAYMEASNKNLNDTCTIRLPALAYEGNCCMKMAYHMYGFHVNRLEVNIRQRSGSSKEKWMCQGNQGPKWRLASIQLNLHKDDVVEIVGVRGGGYSGDIAIDDIRLTSGNCPSADQKC